MTTKLERTQQDLAEKTRLLDQALKAQQVMDDNLVKFYELYHLHNQRLVEREGELATLRRIVIKWLPNFHKYAYGESF